MSAGEALAQAMVARGGPGTVIETLWSDPWASATFEGARHEMAMRMPVTRADAFVGGIEEAEWAIRGHLVADIAVVAQATEGEVALMRIEALTVEES